MTTPDGGSFEYTDDSVIARVSVDVPTQALSDIQQLADSMAAMRTQLDAVTEAQGNWVEFLKQMPKMLGDTNDAIKDQITLLERQSYLQQQTGGGKGGAFSTDTSGGGGGGGGGGYSTAAPAGYAPPWQQGQTPGTGVNVPSPAQVEERAARLGAEDPALEANVQSARGTAVNPALLGAVGAAVARKFGMGKPATGANKPGQNADRDADAPPNPAESGAPDTSASQNTPGDANENDTDDSKKQNLITQVLNEFKGGKDGRAARIGGLLLSAAGRQMTAGAGGGGGAGAGGGGGGMLGGLGGIAKNILTSKPGMAAGALGLGAMAFNKVQDIGERVTEYQQLGSVQGGDYMTGMKYEAQARLLALNPFITTQQARQAMQMALKEGFRGDNYDTVQDFMIGNFKELGISMGQSMDLMKSSVRNLTEGDSQAGVKKDLDQTLNTMKEMSAEGGLSFPERVDQLQEMKQELSSLGYSSEAANRAALATQEGMGDSLALRDSAGRISNQINSSSMLNTLAAQKMGITGVLPNALPAAFERAGMDPDEVRDAAAAQIAGYVSGYPDPLNRIAAFQMLMNQYGVELDWPEAEALYGKVSKGQGSLPSKQANNKVARQGKTMTSNGMGRTSSSSADSDWTKRHPSYNPSENAEGESENFDKAGRGSGNFAPSGNTASPLPTSANGQSPQYITSQGVVTGEVRITVDRNGNVTAPPVIQLTGTNMAANAGYSSAQLNNPSPGDPNYTHSYNMFPGGPGGNG